jgi:hypothetical protein
MSATEGSLNFERDPDPETVMVGKHLWKLDISAERIKEAITPLREAVEKLKGLVMAQPAKDRGPDPDFAPDPEPRGQRIAVSGGDYRPSQHPEWARRRNSIMDGLLIAGIIALVSTSIYLLKTTVRLDTQYTERGLLYDERFNAIHRENSRQDIELGRHDERLDRLEQQRRDP